MDLFEKARQFIVRPREVKAAGMYPYFLPLEDTEGTEVTIHGKKIIMAGSNNYLGLTTHPKLREAAIEATRRYGVGSGAVRTKEASSP